MLLRSRLGCSGRRRSAAQRLLLLVPCLWLWSALSYASRSLIGSAVVDLTAFGISNNGGSGSNYATGPIATAATIALCFCAGCTITAAAILVALLRRCCDTERSWHRTTLHWLTTGAGGAAKVDGNRRDDAAFARCLPAPGLLPNLFALAFCHAAVALCELITMAGRCNSCSATVSIEPLAAATLQALIADVADAALATAAMAGAAGAPLTSAALLGLPLASYGAAALQSGDEELGSTWVESTGGWGGAGSGCGSRNCLALAGIATIARLARNFLLRAAYGRLDSATGAAVTNGSESPIPAARLALFAAMNAAACLWLFPAAAVLRAVDGSSEQWRFATGLDPGALAAATLLSSAGTMLSLLTMLPAMTLAEHATARLAKNVLVALAFAATASDEALGSREAAALSLVAVGVVVFVAGGGGYGERSGTGNAPNRHLQTPQCILAAICFAALLFNQGAVNKTIAVVRSSNLKSGPCEVGRIPPAAAAAVTTSLTNSQAAPAILPSSFPLSSAADSVEVFRLQPVATRSSASLVTGNTQPPLPHDATLPQLLPDILTDEPVTVARLSNELKSVNALVAEARRLLDTLLGSLFAGRRRAVLVNLFSWPNKGDHLITIAELRLLERHNITIIHACSFPAVNCRFERVPRGSDLIILLQGGGYSGHPGHQGAFDNVIRSFPDQRVVLLPNSLCYPTAPCSEVALDAFARSLLNHSDFHVLLRDAYSYETTRRTVDDLAKNDYRVGGGDGPWLYLSPDVAWATESLVVNVAPVYDIVWLKRDDWESVDSDPMPPIPQGLRVQVIDWVDSWMGQKGANYWEHLQLRALSGVAFLSRGRVVISDRLHAHIMSQLMRKPNVLVNSKTKKQGHYYTTWERSIETSRLASNNSEALAMAQELLLRHGGPVSLPLVDPV